MFVKLIGDKAAIKSLFEGGTKQKQLNSFLRCPLDKSKVILEHDYLCCKKEHRYKLQYEIIARKVK
jgi:hypothetical protein